MKNNLELRHFFILVNDQAKIADLLLPLGILEGTTNKHEGQGTSNRRFNFTNGTLEFLWVHDFEEAINGPGKGLRFAERTKNLTASPFGILLSRKDNNLDMPFKGWKYQPAYFKSDWSFHVGENSELLHEPLCIYMPFVKPNSSTRVVEQDIFKTICQIKITVPSGSLSEVLKEINSADRVIIESGSEHLIELTFNDMSCSSAKDFRPDIPLVIRW